MGLEMGAAINHSSAGQRSAARMGNILETCRVSLLFGLSRNPNN